MTGIKTKKGYSCKIKFKKVFMFLLMLLCIGYGKGVIANASSISTDEEIEKLFDEMSINYAEDMLHQSSNKAILEKANNTCEEKLKKLGVMPLTTKQVNVLMKKSGISNTVSSAKNVKWYSKNETYTYKKKKYSIQKLYAQGTGVGSRLANGKDGKVLYSDQEYVVKNLSNIASIYAQKALGQVPVVTWMPYELLFSDNSKVTNESHVVTYRSLQTFCYIYVKPYGKSDDYQELCFTSNKVSIASSHTLAGFKNGKAYSKSTDKTAITKAPKYASTLSAVKRYTDSRQPWLSYVENYSFYGPKDGSKTKKFKQNLSLFDNPNLIR